MTEICLIFPHQLIEENPLLEFDCPFYLVEEWLYFHQFPFHKQKLAFHRASMKAYADFLKEKGKEVHYISALEEICDIRKLIAALDCETIHYINTVDDWLEERIESAAQKKEITLNKRESPLFINSSEDVRKFFRADKKKFHQTAFYKQERERLHILLTQEGKPQGGKWTFDTENRKKYPAKKIPPTIQFPERTTYWNEAVGYIETYFPNNYGTVTKDPIYPINFKQAKDWLAQFFTYRFHEFGAYEDAIVARENFLNHSVLSPLINVGLLLPDEVVEQSIRFAKENEVPMNSLEGFVRQIIGWREFIRGIYMAKGVEERNRNFWEFKRPIPKSFYTGSTGIPPIDQTIKKVWKTGYCHHIERLMILANFMTLCEFDPDHIYQWFMELFIDAYDWVMVPNVYGMATFSDGGLMSTKPYISSSNYVIKMSDYKTGDWQQTWDALFWRFMHLHREFFESNPRLSMLLRNLDRMEEKRLQRMLKLAEEFLDELK